MAAEKTLYIHIGQDKTGTSAIQAFLHKNYDTLNARGFDTVGGRCLHHGELQAALVRDDKAALTAAADYVRNSACNNFAISFEGLYPLPEKKVAQLLQNFKEFKLVVVLYLRQHADKFRSGFAQNMKLLRPDQVQEAIALINNDIDNLRPEQRWGMDYLGIVRRWQKQLGKAGKDNEFVLRVYEKSSLHERDLLTDFGRTVKLLREDESFDDSGFDRPKGGANPSLSPTAQYLTIVASLLKPEKPDLKALVQLLADCEEKGADKLSLIPDAVVDVLDKKFAADNKVLAQEFFGRDELFTEPRQFRYAKPDGQDFARLISEMAKARKLFD